MRLHHVVAALVASATLLIPVAADDAPSDAQQADIVTLTIDGDEIQWTDAKKRATVTGNARILICAPGYTGRRAVVRADRVDVDMHEGEVVAYGNARIAIGPALFGGEEIHFDVASEEFTVKRARGCMKLPLGGADVAVPAPTVYFTGAQVGKVGQVVYILHGRLTTCDKDKPHYYVKARRIKYHMGTGDVKVYHAGVHLYGLTVPLIPWAKTNPGGGGGGGKPDLIAVPGYSSREGVYLPYSFQLTDADDRWQAMTSFRVTAKRGITGSICADREVGDWDINVRASRKEWSADDITERLSLYRLPEVTLTKHFDDRTDSSSRFTLDIGLGRFREDLETQPAGQPRRPRVSEGRALAALGYVGNAAEYSKRDGAWYGATGRVSTYTCGETYQDLEVFGGIGGAVSDNLSADATLHRHFPGGTTPFLFDDVDIKTELRAGAEWQFARKWGADGWCRWDVDTNDMRDYEVGLSWRAHCLTWGVYYRDVGNRIGLRLDLTGLTGGTKPFKAHSSFEAEMAKEGLSLSEAYQESENAIELRGDEFTPPQPEPADG